MEGQLGRQAQQVVKGDVKGAQRRRSVPGHLSQLGQGVLGVQRVQIARAVGAGAADADDVLKWHLSKGRVHGRTAPGHGTTLGLNPHKDRARVVHLGAVDRAIGQAQGQLDRHHFDVRDLHRSPSLSDLFLSKFVVVFPDRTANGETVEFTCQQRTSRLSCVLPTSAECRDRALHLNCSIDREPGQTNSETFRQTSAKRGLTIAVRLCAARGFPSGQ